MTKEKLKIEILDIVKILKKSEKPRLAQCIEENWNKSAIAYSKEINSWQSSKPMEKEMRLAFKKELERLEMADNLKLKVLDSLEKRRVLQTAPHLGVTQNPRMLCINWLESLSLDKENCDVIAMFSGIPFSNKSRPGRINRKSNSINLFPSKMQDALVYRNSIPEKLTETVQKLPEKIQQLLPKAVTGASYTKWALKGCEKIQRKIIGKDNLFFLDLNEVATEYLLQVLENKNHILHQIFFVPEIREEFTQTFPNEIMFYSPVLEGKHEVMEGLVFFENILKNKKKEIPLNSPKKLIEELKDKRLCPALITGFLSIAFLNEFKCFGSFAQVEYLPVYQKKLANLKFLKNFDILRAPTANLTTGIFPQNPDLYPADIIIDDINTENFLPDPEILVGELLIPMKDLLINKSYFTGDERKK